MELMHHHGSVGEKVGQKQPLRLRVSYPARHRTFTIVSNGFIDGNVQGFTKFKLKLACPRYRQQPLEAPYPRDYSFPRMGAATRPRVEVALRPPRPAHKRPPT